MQQISSGGSVNKYHLGPLVRQIRLAKGIKLNQFAWDIDFNSSNFSQFEQGKVGALKMPYRLYPIAEALGVSVPALFVMQEICWSDPEILNNPAALLENLERVQSEITQLKKRAA
jgi:transcriptional regulator with XRE-family HTH domain